MLDFLKALIGSFGEFVSLLFTLPFYGNVSYGHMLLALYVTAMVLIYLGGKFR